MELHRREEKVLIIMVGLPCRGKTFLSQQLFNYFNECGLSSRVFNLGDVRRELEKNTPHANYSFFQNFDSQVTKRQQYAEIALQKALSYLEGRSVGIAIYDGTNSS